LLTFWYINHKQIKGKECIDVTILFDFLNTCDLFSIFRCRGAVTRCIKSSLGCTFQGPRSALQSHLWECQFRDQDGGKFCVR